MNQNPPYMDMHAGSHMSSAPSYAHPASAPMSHYPQYQHPPPMQPGSHYAPPQYSNYGYANGVTSPQSATGPMGSGYPSQNIQLPGTNTVHSAERHLTYISSEQQSTASALLRASKLYSDAAVPSNSTTIRHHGANCAAWYETSRHCYSLGR